MTHMLCRLPRPTALTSLSMLLADIGDPSDAAIAKALGTSTPNVAKWRKDDYAPRPVMLSLYWLTRWGISAINAEAMNRALMKSGEADMWKREAISLRNELARVLDAADFGCANDFSVLASPDQAPVERLVVASR